MEISMEAKEFLSKYKTPIIIILLFSLVFFIRAESVSLSSLSDQTKPLFQDDNGLPYFSEMDSYYNLRMTQDYLDHGYTGDTKINGTEWDLHSNYPPGRSANYPPLIVYLTAFFYKLVNIFGQVPLVAVSYWMPAFIASLCVIPAYLFIRGITNDYGGITAALLVSLAPAYFSHTFAGFFDTDMFNVLLPLLVVWFFSVSVTTTDTRRKIIFAVLSAFSLLLFSMAWEGWWYIFYLVVFVAVFYLVVSKYLYKMETVKSWAEYPGKMQWLLDQPVILSLVIFVVLGVILTFLALGSGLLGAILNPVGFTQLQSAVETTSYPNVLVSVAELQIPSLFEVIAGSGGLIAFVFGLLGVFILFWRLRIVKQETEDADETSVKADKKSRKKGMKGKKGRKSAQKEIKKDSKKFLENLNEKERKDYLFYAVLLTIWLAVTIYALTKGVRFVENFSVPIALGAGIFVGIIKDYVGLYIETPSYRTITMVLLVILAAYIPVTNAYATSYSVVPGTDDAMVNSMSWINNNTSKDTVITSWWDFGHLFAVKADRAVTFDGGSQNSARAYWVGKALLTSDENLSAGILKMMATSGDQGYLTLENYTKDTGKTVEIMDKILVVDKTSAYSIMTTQYGLTAEQAQSVLQYTHPDKATPDIFITSIDMAGKAGWWSYFGGWDFKAKNGTSYIYSATAAQSAAVNNTTIVQGENGVVAQINGSQVISGLVVNNTTAIEPHRLIIVENGTKTLDQVVNDQSPISIFLIKEKDSYMTVAMNRELEDSMFTRLFFLRGAGLTRFKMAYQQPQEGQKEVIAWNVN
jgi:asparagine N-glycosylation enzyme membrane subunit Stt3